MWHTFNLHRKSQLCMSCADNPPLLVLFTKGILFMQDARRR
jgi:hypothetical protein